MLAILVVFIPVLFLVFVTPYVCKDCVYIYKLELYLFSLLASIGGFGAPYLTSIITKHVRISGVEIFFTYVI